MQRFKIIHIILIMSIVTFANTSCKLEKLEKMNALDVVKKAGYALNDMSTCLKEDREVFYNAIKNTPFIYSNINSTLKKDKDMTILLLKEKIIQFFKVDSNLKKDKDVVLAALTQEKLYLKDLDDILKKDKDIILMLTTLGCLSYRSIPLKFKNDKDVILKLINNDPSQYMNLNEKFKNNREIALLTVQKDPRMYCFISNDELANDEEIIKASKNKKVIWSTPSYNCNKYGGKLNEEGCAASWNNALKICNATGSRLAKVDELIKEIKECTSTEISSDKLNDRDVLDKEIRTTSYILCYQKKEYKKNLNYWTSQRLKDEKNDKKSEIKNALVINFSQAVYKSVNINEKNYVLCKSSKKISINK